MKSRKVQQFEVIISIILITILLFVLSYLAFPANVGEPAEEIVISSTPEPTPEPTAAPTPTIAPTSTPTPKEFRLHQIAVGCANAYLIEFDDITIMIDGGLGNAKTWEKVKNYLEMANIAPLDAYIATHLHGDHVGNTERILKNFGDDSTVVYGPNEIWYGWIENYKKKVDSSIGNCEYRQMKMGDIIKFDELKFTCVGPSSITYQARDNKESLNFVIEYGNHKFFMTGDYVLSDVMRYADVIKDCDVFQFPHHGLYGFAIKKDVFMHVNPKIILVPDFSSEPSRAWAKELEMDSAFYDDESGNIVVASNGTDLKVYTDVFPGQFAK